MSEQKYEMKQKAERALMQAKAIVDGAAASRRDVSASELRRVEELCAEHDRLMREAGDPLGAFDASDFEARLAEGRKIPRPFPRPGIPGSPMNMQRTSVVGGTIEDRKAGRIFGNGPTIPHGFQSSDDFLRSVATGGDGGRLGDWSRRAMEGGLGSSGGHLVPSQYANEIWDQSLEMECVRPLANVYRMLHDTMHVPALGIGDHSSDRHGGIVSRWTGEGSSIDETQPAFREVVLQAKKLSAYGVVSREALRDGPAFGEALQRAFAGELAWKMDLGFIRGSGSGEPLGLLNCAAAIEQDPEGGQSEDTLIAENIFKMWSRLAPGGASTAVWLVHPSVLPELYSINIEHGLGGTAVFAPGGSIAGTPHSTLMGRPLIVTEKASILGDAADVILFDPRAYAIGLREEIEILSSEHVHFQSDQVGVRGTVRVDGACLWNEPMTLRDGSHTVSPIVYLGARD